MKARSSVSALPDAFASSGAARRRHAMPLVGCGGSRARLPPVAAARFGQVNSRSLFLWRQLRGAGGTAVRRPRERNATIGALRSEA